MNFNSEQQELLNVLIGIRNCQYLCVESQHSTTLGNFNEFHNILNKVKRIDPVNKQKILIQKMHRLVKQIDNSDPSRQKTDAVFYYANQHYPDPKNL